MTSLVVRVDPPVDPAITLECPELVVASKEFQCNASIKFGTCLTQTLDYEDGTKDAFKVTGK